MTNAAGIPITDKTCLIMDEVNGMSAGDVNTLIKKDQGSIKWQTGQGGIMVCLTLWKGHKATRHICTIYLMYMYSNIEWVQNIILINPSFRQIQHDQLEYLYKLCSHSPQSCHDIAVGSKAASRRQEFLSNH
jgi:hypothetical protein